MNTLIEHSPAAILQKYLVEQGLVTNGGDGGEWPCWVSSLPDGNGTPDQAIGILDGVGKLDGRYMRTGETVLHPGLEILVRSLDYEQTYYKIAQIYNHCLGIRNEEVEYGEVGEEVVYQIKSFSVTDPIGPPKGEGKSETRDRLVLCFKGRVTLVEVPVP